MAGGKKAGGGGKAGDWVQEGPALRGVRRAEREGRFGRVSEGPDATLPARFRIPVFDCRELRGREGMAHLVLTDPPWDQHHRHLLGPMAAIVCRWLKSGGLLPCHTGDASMPFIRDAFRWSRLSPRHPKRRPMRGCSIRWDCPGVRAAPRAVESVASSAWWLAASTPDASGPSRRGRRP